MRLPDARVATVTLLAALSGGCAVDRTSVLDDRGPIQTSWEDHFSVAVVAVDGVPRSPGLVEVGPGRHDVTFEARPSAGVPVPKTKTIAMSIIPCTSYRMVARPGSESAHDWNVLIEHSNPTSACADRGGGYAQGAAEPAGPGTSFRF